MNLLIAGGGTGGHLFPGIALAQELRRRDQESRILFVGTTRGIEARAVPEAGFDLAFLPIRGLRGKNLFTTLGSLLRIPWSMFEALLLVRRFRPTVAVSVGGYAAGPAVLAARIWGVPCVVVEQNAVIGLTNRILGKIAQAIVSALPVSEGFEQGKVKVLGNPVRRELARVRDISYEVHKPLRVLVFGGSQGAKALNETLTEAAPALLERGIELRHQTGRRDAEWVSERYKALGASFQAEPFITDMGSAYGWADLVISRSGATTVAELTVCGRPAILVPFPFAVDDHQTANGKALVEAGAAYLVPQPEFTADKLVQLIDGFLASPESLEEMASKSRALGRPQAASEIVDVLEEQARV